MNVSTTTAPTPAVTVARHDVARGAALGAALAVPATLGIYLVGMAGAPIRVVTGWAPDGADLTVLEVVATVVVALALGALLLAALQRRLRRGFAVWVVVAACVAIGSAVPLFRLDIDLQSQLSLASMHLATGAAAVTGHVLARRHRLRSRYA